MHGGSDFTRYLPLSISPVRLGLASGGGAAVTGLWMYLVGAAIGTFLAPSGPAELVTGTVPSGMAKIALAALLVASLAASVLDIYSASLCVLIAGVRLARWQAAAVVGVLGGVVGWIGGHDSGQVFTNFQNFLLLMSYWLGPWIAITLVDHLIVKRGEPAPASAYDRRRRFGPGLLPLLAGVAAAIPFMKQDMYTGPIASALPQVGDIAYWVGFVVAGGGYWLLAGRSRGEIQEPVVPATDPV